MECAQVAADNGGGKSFVDLLVQRLAVPPVEGNRRKESYLPHSRNRVVIPICLEVVIVSDTFPAEITAAGQKVQLPATVAVWV